MNTSQKFLVLFIAILLVGPVIYLLNFRPKVQSSQNTRLTQNPDPSSADPDFVPTNDAVAAAFAQKYSKPASDFTLDVEVDTGTFAKGSVRIKDEMGGAVWFAAKTAQGWELAADGQGPMSCDIAAHYSFPVDLVPSCIDTQNGNVLIQR